MTEDQFNQLNSHTMCDYCNSVNGGHTLACQALQMEGVNQKQISVPEDSPWLQRRLKERKKDAN